MGKMDPNRLVIKFLLVAASLFCIFDVGNSRGIGIPIQRLENGRSFITNNRFIPRTLSRFREAEETPYEDDIYSLPPWNFLRGKKNDKFFPFPKVISSNFPGR